MGAVEVVEPDDRWLAVRLDGYGGGGHSGKEFINLRNTSHTLAAAVYVSWSKAD